MKTGYLEPPKSMERGPHSKTSRGSRKGKAKDQLDWSGNNLSSLDALNLFPDLVSLNLSENKIQQITFEVSSCTKLRRLDLSSNLVPRIENLRSLPHLQHLNLSHNSIIRMEGLQELQELETLDVSYNQIRVLGGLSACPRLRRLVASHNMIGALASLLQNKELVHLDLRSNKVASLSNASECLPVSLVSLYLGQNVIEDILCPLFLLFLDSLEDLDLSGNPAIEQMKKENIDFRAFITFLTHEKIRVLNHSIVTEEELVRSRRYFVDKRGQFQKDLFHYLITEEENRTQLVQYLASLSEGERKKSLPRPQESPAVVYSPVRNTVSSNSPPPSAVNPQTVSQYECIQMIRGEISELKDLVKLRVDKSPKKTLIPLYIMLLEGVHTSLPKLTKSTKSSHKNLIKLQAWIRGFLVRNRIHIYRYQQFCIVKIQSFFRGYRVRRRKRLKRSPRPREMDRKPCPRCLENEQRITALTIEVASLRSMLEENQKIQQNTDQALRYLFTQVKTLKSSQNSVTQSPNPIHSKAADLSALSKEQKCTEQPRKKPSPKIKYFH